MRIDFELSGHGTVYLFRPITRAARVWVDEHLPADATWWCGAVVVEHRYIGRSSAVRSASSALARCAFAAPRSRGLGSAAPTAVKDSCGRFAVTAACSSRRALVGR